MKEFLSDSVFFGVAISILAYELGVFLKKMTYIAKQNRRSFNAQMEFLAENCIKSYEKSHGKIVLEEKKK